MTDRRSLSGFGVIHFLPRLLLGLRVSVVKFFLVELFQTTLRNDGILARLWTFIGFFLIFEI